MIIKNTEWGAATLHKYEAPDKACKGERKLRPQRHCVTCFFKATQHFIGELKAFAPEWPYNCVGGRVKHRCAGRQGRDILTEEMLYIVSYLDVITDRPL